jgi:hypothetical protein
LWSGGRNVRELWPRSERFQTDIAGSRLLNDSASAFAWNDHDVTGHFAAQGRGNAAKQDSEQAPMRAD